MAVSKGKRGSTSQDKPRQVFRSQAQAIDKTQQAHRTEIWQRRLLPWMIGSLLGMGVIFFLASMYQLYRLEEQVRQPAFDLMPVFEVFENQIRNKEQFESNEYLKWKTLVLLEQDIVQRRYHQVNASMMARVWTRYLGFVTGMILALTGAVFILGKLQEPTSQLEASAQDFKFALITSSPGIVLATLGTALILVSLIIPFEIETKDVAVYARQVQAVTGEQPNFPPPPPFTSEEEIRRKEKELFGPQETKTQQ